MRRVLLFMSAGMFVAGCLSLYLMLELQMPPSTRHSEINKNDEAVYSPDSAESSPLRHNELNNIETKIKQIEEDLQRNHKTISDIKSALHDIVQGDVKSLEKLRRTFDAMDSTFGGGQRVGYSDSRKVTTNPVAPISATRFVMPWDKQRQISRLNAKDVNASKSCLLSRSQSKAGVRMLD